MGYRIVYKDITVEVDTLVEFENALNIFRGLEIKHKTSKIPEPPVRSLLPPEATEKVTTTSKMVSFYRSLIPGPPLNIINVLYDNPEGLTSEELQKILDVTPGGLGGTLGGVTKAAKPYGLHGNDIVSKPKEIGGRYQLTPSMYDVIRGKSIKDSKQIE